jgi:hypothetical protein
MGKLFRENIEITGKINPAKIGRNEILLFFVADFLNKRLRDFFRFGKR